PFTNRSFDFADLTIVLNPQTDLAILNYIARHIVETGRVDRDFVERHVVFRRGNTDIGYGLRSDHPLERAAKNVAEPGGSQPITFEEYAVSLRPYTADYVSPLSGVPAWNPRAPAERSAEPKTTAGPFSTMGSSP